MFWEETHVSRLFSHFVALVAGLIAAVAVGCSGMGEPTGPVESTPEASPTQAATASSTQATTATSTQTVTTQTATATSTQTAAASPTQTGTTTPTPATGYDSTQNMFRMFSGPGHNPDEARQAISLAVANNDKSMVPVMIEMLRFLWGPGLAIDTDEAISAITGRESTSLSRAWNEWMEWLVKNADEYSPPDGYVRWKVGLMSPIDPRFGEFLAPAEQGSRINVSEIAWGGVRPDGIPDLQNAPAVYADEQDYLQPSDRVFGVSINGDHRAYPLRIVNAHEMANDVLGGEPIALAY